MLPLHFPPFRCCRFSPRRRRRSAAWWWWWWWWWSCASLSFAAVLRATAQVPQITQRLNPTAPTWEDKITGARCQLARFGWKVPVRKKEKKIQSQGSPHSGFARPSEPIHSTHKEHLLFLNFSPKRGRLSGTGAGSGQDYIKSAPFPDSKEPIQEDETCATNSPQWSNSASQQQMCTFWKSKRRKQDKQIPEETSSQITFTGRRWNKHAFSLKEGGEISLEFARGAGRKPWFLQQQQIRRQLFGDFLPSARSAFSLQTWSSREDLRRRWEGGSWVIAPPSPRTCQKVRFTFYAQSWQAGRRQAVLWCFIPRSLRSELCMSSATERGLMSPNTSSWNKVINLVSLKHWNNQPAAFSARVSCQNHLIMRNNRVRAILEDMY